MTTTDRTIALTLIGLALVMLVPLGLRLLRLPVPPWTIRALAVVSLALPVGPLGAAAAIVWAAWAAWLGVFAVRARRSLPLGALLAAGWLANAAGWLVAQRAGFTPLGFDAPITLLTVAHFHWAGFGLTALFTSLRRHRAARLGLVAHQIGMGCVALGLSFDDRAEVLGAGLLTLALVSYSVAALQHRASGSSGWRGLLLAVSAVAWIVPMALATTWALAPFGVTPIADRYDTMLRYHGAVNAFGLVLLGVLALTPSSRPAAPGRVPQNRLPHVDALTPIR